ncbi:MAG: hypothetical protein L6R38_006806, partial [Xanthoria sp. 2 TBL-2021]
MARPIPNPQDWVRPPQVGRWWLNSPQRELWKVAIDLRRIPWVHLDKTENNVSPGLHTCSLEAALKLAQWLNPQSPLPLPNAQATGDYWGYLQRHNIKVAQQPLPMLRSRLKNVEKTTIPCLREVSDQKFAEYEQSYGPGINNEDLIHRARGTKYIYFHGQLPVGGALVKPGVNSVTEKVGYYYGGPIVDISTGEWRRAHPTDNARDLITLGPLLPAVPDDLSLIVQATAVMSSKYMTQSALKVGHRVILSTLNFHHWLSDTPSAGEVQMVCDKFETFHVESDVDSTPPSSRSVKAGLVAYSIEDDLGIFKLLNHFEPHQHSVPLDRLLEREGPDWKEILQPGREVACIAYNAGTEDGFAGQIQHYANSILREHWELP